MHENARLAVRARGTLKQVGRDAWQGGHASIGATYLAGSGEMPGPQETSGGVGFGARRHQQHGAPCVAQDRLRGAAEQGRGDA